MEKQFPAGTGKLESGLHWIPVQFLDIDTGQPERSKRGSVPELDTNAG